MRALWISLAALGLTACGPEVDNSGFIDEAEFEKMQAEGKFDDHDHDGDGVPDHAPGDHDHDDDHDHDHDGDGVQDHKAEDHDHDHD